MKHRLFWEDWLSGWSGIILKSHSPYIVKSASKVHFSSFSFVTFTFTFSFVILINISINRGLYRTWRNQKKPTSMKYNPMCGIWHYLLLFRHINASKMEETAEAAERPSSCLMITASIQIHFHVQCTCTMYNVQCTMYNVHVQCTLYISIIFPWNKTSSLQFEVGLIYCWRTCSHVSHKYSVLLWEKIYLNLQPMIQTIEKREKSNRERN